MSPWKRPLRSFAIPCMGLAALGWAIRLGAGDLTPPPGPIAPTFKTLSQVEPRISVDSTNTPGSGEAMFVISEPGSYYLTGNMKGAPGRSGIVITAADVTLDLAGFMVEGVPGSKIGVYALTNIEGATVRNGSVQGWGTSGISLGLHSRVENVRASGCGTSGISLASGSSVSSCRASDNDGFGFYLGDSSEITDSSTRSNKGAPFHVADGSRIIHCSSSFDGAGISVATGCLVADSTVTYAAGDGVSSPDSGISFGSTFRSVSASGCLGLGFNLGQNQTVIGCNASNNKKGGIVAGDGSNLDGCTANKNEGIGISVGTGASVSRSIARSNSGSGIQTGSHGSVSGCQSTENGAGTQNLSHGILVGSVTTVTGCTCRGNTADGINAGGFFGGGACIIEGCCAATNGLNGINVPFDECLVSRCVASNNHGIGIIAGPGASVLDCVADRDQEGIQGAGTCRIMNNSCTGEAVGIRVTGAGGRIEGNSCSTSGAAITVEAGDNVVVRNSGHGNPAFTVAAGCVFGPAINAAAVASSSNPHANYVH